VTDKELKEALDRLAKQEEDGGAEMSFGRPNRWRDAGNVRWRCRNEHVSGVYLKSEGKGGAVCLQCFEFVSVTFPEDKDGPLVLTLPSGVGDVKGNDR